MERIGVLPPEELRAMYQWYLTQKQLPAQLTKHFPQRRPVEDVSPHRVFVKNTETEAIPPYACMRVIGTEEVGGQTVVRVKKPTSTDGEFLFNSPYEIPAPAAATEEAPAILGVGWAYRYGVVVMLGEIGSGSASGSGSGFSGTTGESGIAYEPVVGSWRITEGPGPFVVFGPYDLPNIDGALIGRISGSSSSIRWGKITSVLGCGWYMVELGTLDGDYDASASLSASGDECSPCGNVTGAGTSGCAMTLTMPSPKVVGSGTSVMAYDPASIVIPLIAGTDCVVGKVPGTPAGSGSGVSGSGSGGATETAWAVLRGFQQHSVDYKERWDCCDPDGPPVLVGKTPVVYIGFTCGEIACGECP